MNISSSQIKKPFDRTKNNAEAGRKARQIEFAHKRHAVEQEFGESFEDVIKGFARDGESASATAAILDYSPSAFLELLRREGLSDLFVSRKSGSSHERLQAALVRIRELEAEVHYLKSTNPPSPTDGA